MPFSSIKSGLRSAVSAITVTILSVGSSACAGTHSERLQESPIEQTRSVDLKKGQVLQLYVEDRKVDAEPKRTELLATTTPLAAQYGLKQHIEFAVRATAAGTFKPNAVSLHSAPSIEALSQLSTSADWAGVQPLREAVYNDAKTFSQILQEDISLTFDPTKIYTIGLFWMNQENPDDFKIYLDGLTPVVESLGGRFMHQMYDPQFSAVSSSPQGPGRVIFIEWESPEGLGKLSSTTAYQELQRYRISGTTYFEFHILQPQLN